MQSWYEQRHHEERRTKRRVVVRVVLIAAGLLVLASVTVWLRGGSIELLQEERGSFGISARYIHADLTGGGEREIFDCYEIDFGLVAILVR